MVLASVRMWFPGVYRFLTKDFLLSNLFRSTKTVEELPSENPRSPVRRLQGLGQVGQQVIADPVAALLGSTP